MDFIVHKSICDNRVQFWLMDINGFCHAKAYIFDDQKERIFLSELSVCESERRNGIGLLLQEAREDIGRENGCTESMLWATKGSWQKEWYERRGYEYSSEYEKYNAEWMLKKIES